MGVIGAIYVEVMGDTTIFDKQMRQLRSDAKKSGTAISDALNNAITPAKAEKSLGNLTTSIEKLAKAAKVPGINYKASAMSIAHANKDVSEKIGMTTIEFAKLNEKMLKTQAYNTAEKNLKTVGREAGLSTAELKKLALGMKFTDIEATKMSGEFGKLQLEAYGMNRAFDQSSAAAKKLAIDLDKAHSEALKMAKSMDVAYDKMRHDALKLNDSFDLMANNAAVAFDKIRHDALKMNADFDKSVDKMRHDALKANEAFDRMKFDKIRNEASQMNAEFTKSAEKTKKLAYEFDKARHQADKMNAEFDQSRIKAAKMFPSGVMSSISSMKGHLLAVGIAAVAGTYAIKRMTEAIWDAGQRTLVAENAYKSITGSTAAANVQFEFLSKTAEELGLNFFTLREGYKGFLAAAKSSTLPMVEIQEIFKSVSNAGAILGLSNEKMSLTFLALEQMLSKGKVSMEEIRRQMGDSLPSAFQTGARAMGMTVEAFDKAVSAGEVYTDDFLPKFRVALDNTFQGTIAESVKSVNKLSQEWEKFKLKMAEGDFMHNISVALKEITEMLKDPDFISGITGLSTVMSQIVVLAAKYASFQGKSFGLAEMQNEAGRLQGAGLISDVPWDDPEQLAKMVHFFQNIEDLSASAAEKIKANTESAISGVTDFTGVSADEVAASIATTTVALDKLRDKYNDTSDWFSLLKKSLKIELDTTNAEAEILRLILPLKRAKESADATTKAYQQTANALMVLKSFEEGLTTSVGNLGDAVHGVGWKTYLQDTLNVTMATDKLTEAQKRLKNEMDSLRDIKIDNALDAEFGGVDKRLDDIRATGEARRAAMIKANEEMQSPLSPDYESDFSGMSEDEELAYAEKSIEEARALAKQQLDVQQEADRALKEMSMSKFDLERAQVERMSEIYENALVDKVTRERIAAKKIADINRAEQIAKLDLYQNAAGGIADTFLQISQAGGEQSEKAFKMYKAFAMAQAVISGAQAILSAMSAPWPLSIATVAVAAVGTAIQLATIANSQPPSYDQGGISQAKGIYQTGDISEAHIPIPSGGKIPVKMEGGEKAKTVNINLNNPNFQDVETQRRVFAEIATVIVNQAAPGAIIRNYNDGGVVRNMVKGGL